MIYYFEYLLGEFDLIIASNLLCRLPSPSEALQGISSLLKPGGTLILVSPYSWLEEYTKKEEWIGACNKEVSDLNKPKEAIYSEEAVVDLMLSILPKLQLISRSDIPFLIREHKRKFQYGVSECLIFNLSS